MQLAGIEHAQLDVAVGGVAEIFVLAQHNLEDVVEASKVLRS